MKRTMVISLELICRRNTASFRRRLWLAAVGKLGMVNWCWLPIGGRVSALRMSGVRHRVAGSLRSEAATAGDVAAAPPASSKAPAVAGEVPREVPSSK